MKRIGSVCENSRLLLFSILLGISCLIGYTYTKYGDWSYITNHPVSTIVFVFGSAAVFYFAGKKFVDKILRYGPLESVRWTWYKTIFIALLILLCWLPHIILFYPGAINYDGLIQLSQYTGEMELTDAHPVFSTWMIGAFLSIGRLIGSEKVGVFLFTFSMCIGGSLFFSYTFQYLRVFPKWVSMVFFAFYAFIPLWPSTFYTMVKDVPYTLMLMVFMLMLVEYVGNPKEFISSPKRIAAISISGTLACLIRPNALLIVVVSAVVVLFWKGTPQKSVVFCFLIPLLVWAVVSKVVAPAVGVTQVTSIDQYNIPFQQLGRYMKYYEDELTSEQEQVLGEYFVLEGLKKNYNPVLSDPIKNIYIDPKADPQEWLRVWLELGIKHPGCYLQAWINQSYGYYSPVATVVGEKGFYYNYFSISEEIIGMDNSFADCGFWDRFASQRTEWERVAMKISELPVVKLFYVPGTYLWLLALTWILLEKAGQEKYAICLISGIVTFLMTLYVPVNTYLRYGLPMMLSAPYLLAFALNLAAGSKRQ